MDIFEKLPFEIQMIIYKKLPCFVQKGIMGIDPGGVNFAKDAAALGHVECLRYANFHSLLCGDELAHANYFGQTACQVYLSRLPIKFVRFGVDYYYERLKEKQQDGQHQFDDGWGGLSWTIRSADGRPGSYAA